MALTLGGSVAPTLALKRFAVDESGLNGNYVEIVGRPRGLMGFILSAIGLDNEWRLLVTGDRAIIRTASIAGEEETIIPLYSVSSINSGYRKPIEMIVLAILTFWTIILPVLFVVMYFINKSTVVNLTTVGGQTYGLKFIPGVIEGVSVDQAQAKRAAGMINELVMRARSGAKE